MGYTKGPYKAEFPKGSTVQIASRTHLEDFLKTWLYHHKIEPEQLNHAGEIAKVKSVGYYHGGDELYELEGISGIWHEQCLEWAAPTWVKNPGSWCKSRRRAVARCKDYCEGHMGLIEMAHELGRYSSKLGLRDDPDFKFFQAIDKETAHLPVGRYREGWARDALIEKDKEVREIEAFYRDNAIRAATNIIAKLADRRIVTPPQMSRKAIKGALHNFLGTYTSRYSDYKGYWLFGLLVGDVEHLYIDLLGSQMPEAHDTCVGAAILLARQRFHEQMRKARITCSPDWRASLDIHRFPEARKGYVDGYFCTHYIMKFEAQLATETGKIYKSEISHVVRVHDPRFEIRSGRCSLPE